MFQSSEVDVPTLDMSKDTHAYNAKWVNMQTINMPPSNWRSASETLIPRSFELFWNFQNEEPLCFFHGYKVDMPKSNIALIGYLYLSGTWFDVDLRMKIKKTCD